MKKRRNRCTKKKFPTEPCVIIKGPSAIFWIFFDFIIG